MKSPKEILYDWLILQPQGDLKFRKGLSSLDDTLKFYGRGFNYRCDVKYHYGESLFQEVFNTGEHIIIVDYYDEDENELNPLVYSFGRKEPFISYKYFKL